MKRILTAILCAAAVCACSKGDSSPVEEEQIPEFRERHDIVLTKSQQALVDAGNSFAFEFLKALHPLEDGQEVFISPFSLQTAFSMLSNGAAGETLSQMAAAIGFGGYSADEINSTYKILLSELYGADSSTKFSVANALWLGKNFQAKKDFTAVLQDSYDAGVATLDFGSPQAAETINSWAEENTFGMIPEFVDHTDPNWVYVLTNALYFNGIWGHKFDSAQTRKEAFIRADGSEVQLDFMRKDVVCRHAYVDKLSASLCELPFGNGAFALDILLPEEGIDFGAFVQKLDDGIWNAAAESLRYEDVFVIVPRLELSYSGSDNVADALKALGMTDAFDASKADFSGLSDVRTCISEVIHKARFKMDERGAEASAVTALVVKEAESGPAPEFFTDHPFLFAIRETSTGAILFLGTFRGL